MLGMYENVKKRVRQCHIVVRQCEGRKTMLNRGVLQCHIVLRQC